jgi:IS1 family transposase
MNKLNAEKRKAIVSCLMEGMGVRATGRITGTYKQTVLNLQRDLGNVCAKLHDDRVRGLKPRSVQCDEVWSFNFCKEKNVKNTKLRDTSYGNCWIWTAIDPDSKLIISYLIGRRGEADAHAFMDDLAGRVIDIGTLVTDGFSAYPPAVKAAFGKEVDYAQLVKVYENPVPGASRYSPAACVGCVKKSVIGFPHADRISTSIVERSNLTLRMSMRRMTRLTNAHSKKLENHVHAFELFVVFYNFCRKHESLKGKTPAMAAGLTDHIWSLDELISLML